ncbi:MAG: hypothetical protein ACXABY_20080 [Candidatus Thorarchaeota archaeon]|jgi:hypothetical protein
MGWREEYDARRAREQSIQNARVTKGWVTEGQSDPETVRFRDRLSKVITDELIQRIEHIPEMTVRTGPYSHTYNNNERGNLIASISLDASLDINWIHGPRLAQMGFQVSGVNQTFTLEGVIGYINEEWIPKQKPKLPALRKRAKIMEELKLAMQSFNARELNYGDISKLMRSVLVGSSTAKHWDSSIIYVIADKAGFKAIDDFKDHYWASGFMRDEERRSGRNNPHDYSSLRFIAIVARIDKNKTRIQHFDSQFSRRYDVRNESSWFSPANLMPQLDKYAKKHTCVTAILTNPEVGSASV